MNKPGWRGHSLHLSRTSDRSSTNHSKPRAYLQASIQHFVSRRSLSNFISRPVLQKIYPPRFCIMASTSCLSIPLSITILTVCCSRGLVFPASQLLIVCADTQSSVPIASAVNPSRFLSVLNPFAVNRALVVSSGLTWGTVFWRRIFQDAPVAVRVTKYAVSVRQCLTGIVPTPS